MFLCESFVWKGIHQISKSEVTSNVANYYSVCTDVFSSLSEFSFLTQVLGLSLWSYLVEYVCAILLVHLSIICGWLKERQWISLTDAVNCGKLHAWMYSLRKKKKNIFFFSLMQDRSSISCPAVLNAAEVQEKINGYPPPKW